MSSLWPGLATRFALGALGGGAASLAAFGRAVFEPGEAAFESLALALLCASLAAFVRTARRAEALVLVVGYGLLRLGLGGWNTGLTALGLGTGAFVTMLVFDELGLLGVRFGKFLILGPLLGGACVAVAPLTVYAQMGYQDSLRPLMLHLFMGVVVGDGVGIGVELAELLPWSRRSSVPMALIRTVAEPGGKAADGGQLR